MIECFNEILLIKKIINSNEKIAVICTCEHAKNKIPLKYKKYFRNVCEVLKTHRGYDIGIFNIAKKFSIEQNAPLFYGKYSRLLVDLNRSENANDIFSEYTLNLSPYQKKKIIELYYLPFRKKVETEIKRLIKNNIVIHLSFHSFTPELDGVFRSTDIGLLYDPACQLEKRICRALRSNISAKSNDIIVKYNYPYKGISDSFTTYLRKLFPSNKYAGIEIEINQKHLH